MRAYRAVLPFLLVSVLFCTGSTKAAGPLYINEILASNTSFGKDAQGEYDDWIEIYNAGTQAVDCGGMYLTDDSEKPQKWQIPTGSPTATTIAAGGYVVIWADGDVDDSGLHANFSLSAAGDEVHLFDTDGVTLIDEVSFDQQQVDTSLGRLPDGGDEWQSLAQPTPKAANVAVYEGIAEKPQFSPEAGFCEGEFLVTISTSTEGASIYYTTDGGEPYVLGGRMPTGTLYTQPLRVARTTCLRAKAIKSEWKSSAIATRTYIFVQDVIRQSSGGTTPGTGWPSSGGGQAMDYGMDPDVVNNAKYGDLVDDALLAIPSISLVTTLDNLFGAQNGIYTHAEAEGDAWERPVSVELLNPDGSEGFQIDAGLRIRGGFSRTSWNPKHAFRLFFRSEYGQSRLKFPLFGDEGTDEFECVDLRTSQNYSWAFQGDSQNTMVREVFSRDLQGEMGPPHTRSRYYHLYLNGQYWGLYQTQERSEASFAASYLGGDKEDFDVMKSESGSYSMVATDGTTDAYRRLYNAAIAGLADNARYFQIQGLNPDGTPNPGYERLLDPDNLADFMIIDYYTGDRDGPGSRFVGRPNNTFGVYSRENPDGWKWFQHDNEHTLGVSQSETNLVTPYTTAGAQWAYFNPHWLHEQLARNNAEYRTLFADHVYRHFFNDGLLTPAASIARIQRRASQIELAIIAESARWGDAQRNTPYTKAHWDAEVSRIIDNYLPTRTATVLGQFKTVGWYPAVDPPAFNQRGGHVAGSFSVHLSAGSGAIYYTLDGSDPRLAGGAVNAVWAQSYTQPIQLTASVRVRARTLSGGVWSPLNEAVFAVGPVAESLRIREIMYNPADDPNAEFIELANVGAETIDLNLVRFTEGIEYAFPSFELPAGGCCLLVRDIAVFEARYGNELPVLGQFAGNLNNAGEKIELIDAAGEVIESFEYEDGWSDLTDGMGYSLNRSDSAADGSDPNGWYAAPPSPGLTGF
ncbi:MAG: lamin tail domain-containing protein [Phycisphaerales bacterium]